jgi:hypothetical protein
MWHFKKQKAMIRTLTILTTILSLTALAQTNKNIGTFKIDNSNLNIDTSKIAILTYDTIQNRVFIKASPANLTSDDLVEIETLFTICIDEHNIEKEKEYLKMKEKQPRSKLSKDFYVIDTKRHKRQYIAVINEKGEKEVWINCFCNSMNKNWRKVIIGVDDGGNCFFNLKINLTAKKYYDLMVNGHA